MNGDRHLAAVPDLPDTDPLITGGPVPASVAEAVNAPDVETVTIDQAVPDWHERAEALNTADAAHRAPDPQIARDQRDAQRAPAKKRVYLPTASANVPYRHMGMRRKRDYPILRDIHGPALVEALGIEKQRRRRVRAARG